MSNTSLPHHQTINGVTARDGAVAFAGVINGNVYYGNTGAGGTSTQDVPSKPTSTVPFRRDPDFVDRGDSLAQIDQRCSQPAGRVALVGLGGVGKSQLAIEYSYRVRERSPQTWVFWVHASNSARFEGAYKNIADIVHLPGRDDTTTNVLQLVFRWLCIEASGQWLMIVDNADDASMFDRKREDVQNEVSGGSQSRLTLTSLLPQSQNGSILITSRNRDVAVKLSGRDKYVINIQNMSRDQGIELLQKKLSNPLGESASELLATLGDIPLAISQAAACINKNWPRTTVASYLQDLNTSDKRREKLLNQAATDLRRDEEAIDSILATWQKSFERIREEKPSAADLLSFMSFFNPQGIPDTILWYYPDEAENAMPPVIQQLSRNASTHFRRSGDDE